MVRAPFANTNFSALFSSSEVKFSWCASPIEVKITVSGRIIRSRRTISPGQDIPASINANSSSPSIISSESATPNCEL